MQPPHLALIFLVVLFLCVTIISSLTHAFATRRETGNPTLNRLRSTTDAIPAIVTTSSPPNSTLGVTKEASASNSQAAVDTGAEDLKATAAATITTAATIAVQTSHLMDSTHPVVSSSASTSVPAIAENPIETQNIPVDLIRVGDVSFSLLEIQADDYKYRVQSMHSTHLFVQPYRPHNNTLRYTDSVETTVPPTAASSSTSASAPYPSPVQSMKTGESKHPAGTDDDGVFYSARADASTAGRLTSGGRGKVRGGGNTARGSAGSLSTHRPSTLALSDDEVSPAVRSFAASAASLKLAARSSSSTGALASSSVTDPFSMPSVAPPMSTRTSGAGSHASAHAMLPAFIISTFNDERISSLKPLLVPLDLIQWTWFRALTPASLIKGDGFVPLMGDNKEFDTVLACFLSHVRVMRQVLEADAPVALVIEDDIRFHVNAQNMILAAAKWLEKQHSLFARDPSKVAGKQEPPHIVSVGFLPHQAPPIPPPQVGAGHAVLWPARANDVWGLQAYLISREGARRVLEALDRPTLQDVRLHLLKRKINPYIIADWALYQVCGRALLYPPAALEGNLPSSILAGREDWHLKWSWNAQTRGEVLLKDYVGWREARALPRMLQGGGTIVCISAENRVDKQKHAQKQADFLQVPMQTLSIPAVAAATSSATFSSLSPAEKSKALLLRLRTHVRALEDSFGSKCDTVFVVEDNFDVTDAWSLDSQLGRIVACGSALAWSVLLLASPETDTHFGDAEADAYAASGESCVKRTVHCAKCDGTELEGVKRALRGWSPTAYLVKKTYIPKLLERLRAAEGCISRPYARVQSQFLKHDDHRTIMSVCNDAMDTDVWLALVPAPIKHFTSFVLDAHDTEDLDHTLCDTATYPLSRKIGSTFGGSKPRNETTAVDTDSDMDIRTASTGGRRHKLTGSAQQARASSVVKFAMNVGLQAQSGAWGTICVLCTSAERGAVMRERLEELARMGADVHCVFRNGDASSQTFNSLSDLIAAHVVEDAALAVYGMPTSASKVTTLWPQALAWATQHHAKLASTGSTSGIWFMEDTVDWASSDALFKQMSILRKHARSSDAHLISTHFFDKDANAAYFRDQFQSAEAQGMWDGAPFSVVKTHTWWRSFNPLCFVSSKLMELTRAAIAARVCPVLQEILFATLCKRNGLRVLDHGDRTSSSGSGNGCGSDGGAFDFVFEPVFSEASLVEASASSGKADTSVARTVAWSPVKHVSRVLQERRRSGKP